MDRPARSPRRYGRPAFVSALGPEAMLTTLTPLDLGGEGPDSFGESWLQALLHAHPELLPITEIEPAFAPAVPLCRELPTAVGPVDLVLISESGLLTLVECKLWRNPEARRTVVGQILDYAKDISTWSYERLQDAVGRANGTPGAPLIAAVRRHEVALDEARFIDQVARNLARSRFLLMIVGDGIRESTEAIAGYLQRQAGLNFTLALVELAGFKLPPAAGGGYVFEPRLLARTVEIERLVVRLEGSGLVAAVPEAAIAAASEAPRRIKITDELFFEAIAKVDPALPALLRPFFDACMARGLAISPGDSSMILHWPDEDLGKVNFGTIRADGTLNANVVCAATERAGDIGIGERYLEGLARLIDGGTVVRPGKPWNWRVALRDGRLPPVRLLLARETEWLACLDSALAALQQLKQTRTG